MNRPNQDSKISQPSSTINGHRAMIDAVDELSRILRSTQNEIERFIFGQSHVIEEALITVLAGGHVLLIGMPGLGKTRLVETLGRVLGLDQKRVQFTPDLMPADILGSEVLEEDAKGRRSFRFIQGPVFAQMLMADEINRASPRTQSALLQAMQENHVSVAGHDHVLPKPFHVLATQNPLEQEGTYPLPEAQLDRFFMQIDVLYPDLNAERQMLAATTGTDSTQPEPIMHVDDLIQAQHTIRQIPISNTVSEAILELVRAGRPDTSPLSSVRENVYWGPGPRASQALMLAVKARAVIQGRLAPSLDDVLALAHPVLRHRMALGFSAHAEGVQLDDVIKQLCDHIASQTLSTHL